jgi:hypothetical protein
MVRMKVLVSLISRHAAGLAAVLFTVASVGFAARVADYSHALHPLSLLGAMQMPLSSAFNWVALVLPGLLVAWLALRLRERASLLAGPGRAAQWAARLGAQLLMISALAFAVQGLLPLDANDLDSARGGRHAAAWMVWWIAFVAGGLLWAIGARGPVQARRLASLSLAAALLLPVLALVLSRLMPAGIAQRLAFALWFAWAIYAEYVLNRAPLSRSAVSWRGW